MRHLLITGARDAKCGALLAEVIETLGLTAGGGFRTIMDGPDAGGSEPVYLYGMDEPQTRDLKHLAGRCKDFQATGYPEVFDAFVPKLAVLPPKGTIILLDQLGLMENQARSFQKAVLDLLDGDIPVLAAVRLLDTPFLNAVRAHPNALCLRLTAENREEIYQEALAFLRRAGEGG